MDWQLLLDILNKDLRCNNILLKINSVRRTEKDVISCFIDNIELRENIVKWLDNLPENEFKKCEAKSKLYKRRANKEFKLKNYDKSTLFYTKTMQYAVSKNEDYFQALAYRSVSLFHLEKFKESKQDAENSMNWDFSPDMRFKLYRQLGQCCLKLNDKQSTEDYLSQAYQYLERSTNISPEEKKKFKIQRQEMLQEFMNSTRNDCLQTDDTSSGNIPQPDFGYNGSFASASGGIDKQYDETKGRFVVANRDIKRKQILFVEKPFAFVLLDHAKNDSICANCCKSQRLAPIPCLSCSDLVYCNEECRTDSWQNHHRWECIGNVTGLWRQIGIAHLAINTFLTSAMTQDFVKFNDVQNLVTNIDKISSEDLTVYSITAMMLMLFLSTRTDLFDTIDLRTSFVAKITNKDLNFDFDLSTNHGKESYTASMLLRFILQMICNGHSITGINYSESDNVEIKNEHQYRIATAIYPSASMMNHSCDPNIMNSFMDQYLIIKCTRDIPQGQEVLNCYGPHYRRMPKKERQKCLKNQYRFTCKCLACTDDNYDNFLDRFSALKCSVCEGPLNMNHNKKCLDCGSSAESKDSLLFELERADQLFDAANDDLKMNAIKTALEKAKQCLMIRQSILYEYNENLAHTFDLIGKIYAISGQYLNAVEYLEHYLKIIKQQFGDDCLAVVEELNKITDICILYLENAANNQAKEYKSTLAKTESFLEEAEEILDLNTGLWNDQYKEIVNKKNVILHLRMMT